MKEMSQAQFDRARKKGVKDFFERSFHGVIFRGVLEDFNFHHCRFTACRFEDVPVMHNADFYKSMICADFVRCSGIGVKFHWASLIDSRIIDCGFRESDFWSARLVCTTIKRTDLSLAHFHDATLIGTHFSQLTSPDHPTVEGVDFDGVGIFEASGTPGKCDGLRDQTFRAFGTTVEIVTLTNRLNELRLTWEHNQCDLEWALETPSCQPEEIKKLKKEASFLSAQIKLTEKRLLKLNPEQAQPKEEAPSHGK